MNKLQQILLNIRNAFDQDGVTTTVIASVLLMVLLLSAYEFIVYRVVSHRAFYNRSFHITVAVLPFFLATIILCLQSNLVITLGTIGALAIIRFRTAIKDPVDMLYILWAVHTGIVCGCQLYEVAVLTSLAVTVVLIMLENVHFGRKPFVLILHCQENIEKEILAVLRTYTKHYKVKSRSFTQKGVDFAIELTLKEPDKVTTALKALDAVTYFSIIEYDAEDIV